MTVIGFPLFWPNQRTFHNTHDNYQVKNVVKMISTLKLNNDFDFPLTSIHFHLRGTLFAFRLVFFGLFFCSQNLSEQTKKPLNSSRAGCKFHVIKIYATIEFFIKFHIK